MTSYKLRHCKRFSMADASIHELGGSRACQEGLSCQGKSAVFFCKECKSYQCSDCEVMLHSSRELKDHQREKVLDGGVQVCELWCSPKTAASCYCQECGVFMCTACGIRIHQGRRKEHVTVEVSNLGQLKGGVTTSDQSFMTANSFLLVNEKEKIMVSDLAVFLEKLGCAAETRIKVVSIFGNTGDGKSHTLNHTFFHGREVFGTSPTQVSGTIGVWAAYSSQLKAIFVDTEGLLGVSSNENQRTRLLLKVLAISDIVIYRTRAERLHNDLFMFLGDASEAYWKFFTPELKAASEKYKMGVPLSTLGPSVIIFHETQHTETLGEGVSQSSEGGAGCKDSSRRFEKVLEEDGSEEGEKNKAAASSDHDQLKTASASESCDVGCHRETSPHPACASVSLPMSAEELLRIRFTELGRIPRAFCSVEYVGTRTHWPPTDFTGLRSAAETLLRNNGVRAPRPPDVVLKALQILNDKFSGNIEAAKVSSFPDAYFTCPQNCLACGARCELSMNHEKDSVPHRVTRARCKYSPQYDNKMYLCKVCLNRGIESVVEPKTSSTGESSWLGLAKYAWTGYVIECKHCGEIYRSRQYWYGNKDPERNAVKAENKHIWPQDLAVVGGGSTNTARRMLDSVGSVAGAIGSASVQPTNMVASWVADRIAPHYWVPNSKITDCGACKKLFSKSDTKHHCRACGGGFCDKCSSNSMPVPWRGWGNIPVRVCHPCFEHQRKKEQKATPSQQSSDSPQYSSETKDTVKDSSQSNSVAARYVGEMVQSAVGTLSGVVTYPRSIIVESARPGYWVSDAVIKQCHQCKTEFDSKDTKHHCRACGQGFCGNCSKQQKAVPSKGWDYPVRVCDSCAARSDL